MKKSVNNSKVIFVESYERKKQIRILLFLTSQNTICTIQEIFNRLKKRVAGQGQALEHKISVYTHTHTHAQAI